MAAAMCLRTPRTGIRSSPRRAGRRGQAGRPCPVLQRILAERVRGSRGRRPLHIVPGDRAFRPGARQPGQADAQVLGQPAHRRLGQGPDRGRAWFRGQLQRTAGPRPGAVVQAVTGRRRPRPRAAGSCAGGGWSTRLDAVADQDRLAFGLLGPGAVGRCRRWPPARAACSGFSPAGPRLRAARRGPGRRPPATSIAMIGVPTSTVWPSSASSRATVPPTGGAARPPPWRSRSPR